MKLLLAIAQYVRDGYPPGYEHWSLVAIAPASEHAHVFEVVGNTDTFAYAPKEKMRLLRSKSLCGGCKVGEMDEAHIEWLRNYLAEIPIIHNDPAWHCQTWVISATRELQQHPEKVTIVPGFSAAKVRQQLEEERALWEVAESHFFEKLKISETI
ncbi:hypothetical protein GY45DRAFT_1243548 [Cubamyces sp. BRFM 1775]|nr:hypothetical protein GY45DRAFT_1243548 [Cubamyces sp. BRFM 1775]